MTFTLILWWCWCTTPHPCLSPSYLLSTSARSTRDSRWIPQVRLIGHWGLHSFGQQYVGLPLLARCFFLKGRVLKDLLRVDACRGVFAGVWYLYFYLRLFVQQQPERRRRAMERRSFLHAPFSRRPACWKFAVRERTRKRTSPSSSRHPLPSPFRRWLNLPWRLARTTQSGSSVRTGLCFRYCLHSFKAIWDGNEHI